MLAAANTIGNLECIGNICNTVGAGGIQYKFTQVISSIIGLLTVAGGLWFVFQIIAGALSWISAGNDKQALENSKKKITQAIIGIVIVISAYTLIGLVGFVFGFDILNLTSLIEQIKIKP